MFNFKTVKGLAQPGASFLLAQVARFCWIVCVMHITHALTIIYICCSRNISYQPAKKYKYMVIVKR
jgi:hypothetical protein